MDARMHGACELANGRTTNAGKQVIRFMNFALKLLKPRSLLQIKMATSLPAAYSDIYNEGPADMDTLKNLGPLQPFAGSWKGEWGLDTKPKKDGPREQPFVESVKFHVLDPVANGPQLLYGLQYETVIQKPNNPKDYHRQVGHMLWEPSTKTVYYTLSIPRGMCLMASGKVEPDAKEFELKATGSQIVSSPFLDFAFKTTDFHIKFTVHDDNKWEYFENTIMSIKDQTEPFNHTDKSILIRQALPEPNPVIIAKGKN
jgi:hypothetical protein